MEWLQGVGLGEYALAFSLEGFDDLSLLLELEPAAVDDLTLSGADRYRPPPAVICTPLRSGSTTTSSLTGRKASPCSEASSSNCA